MLDTPEESHQTSQNRLQQTDSQQSSSAGPVSLDDSPELLRWRADILLDEMMLGAVDVAAGRPEVVSPDHATPRNTLPYGSGVRDGEPKPSSVDRRPERESWFGRGLPAFQQKRGGSGSMVHEKYIDQREAYYLGPSIGILAERSSATFSGSRLSP